MVNLVFGEICSDKYCGIFFCAAADGDGGRRVYVIFAVVMAIESLVRYFGGHALEGFTTVILLLLIIGSLVMMSLGIIGYYISKIYEEVKGRPRYIISRTAGKKNKTLQVPKSCYNEKEIE